MGLVYVIGGRELVNVNVVCFMWNKMSSLKDGFSVVKCFVFYETKCVVWEVVLWCVCEWVCVLWKIGVRMYVWINMYFEKLALGCMCGERTISKGYAYVLWIFFIK